MAFPAVHIKFAFDVKSSLIISNVGDYCAGTIYPDSRYVTRVDRRLTHCAESPNDPFADDLTDFERGWAMHNVYDVRSQSSYTTLLPYPEKDQKLGNHVWCYLTALKVIEDIGIFSSLDLELPFLREISCDIRPMNEDADRLELYFEGLRNLYANEPNLDKYGRLFCDWGLGREVVDSVLAAAAEIDADANIKSRALAIYEEVLKNFKIRNI